MSTISSNWEKLVKSEDKREYQSISLNKDLFNRMVVPACFNQCAKTDVDIVFLNEMECTYKCMITYKQAFSVLKDLEKL